MARINLLPWREELRQERQRNFLIALAVVALIAAGAVFAVNYVYNGLISGQDNRNNFLRAEIRKLDREISRIQELEDVRDRLIARKDVIERLQADRSAMVHLFNQMARSVPEGIRLRSIRQSGERLTITGASQSSTRVSTFLRNLERSPWLHTPTLNIVEAETGGDRDPEHPYRFSLQVRVSPPAQDQEEW